jgi:GNAT superfamily N-acetyltransferase
LLLEALETHPPHRRKGYAEQLIYAVLEKYRPEKLYSHISHRNGPSIGVHQKCGFRKISDAARYADGSVNSRCGTYLYEENAG